jgi:flavin reductase (DIM6/NTAB) family NADH-FMN oxidoreductase RutF
MLDPMTETFVTHDLAGRDADHAYRLLTSLVVPRPIAWISTVDTLGNLNAAPFSFFNVMGDDPPLLAVAPGNRADGSPKDTARNIRDNGEFVVNLVEESQAAAMSLSSAPLAPGESEFSIAGLTPLPSLSVRPPRIAGTAVQLECRLERIIETGGNRVVLGHILLIHTRAGLLDPVTRLPLPGAWQPLGRMHGADGYCRTADFLRVARPDSG